MNIQDALARGQNCSRSSVLSRQQKGILDVVYLNSPAPGSGAAATWNAALAFLENEISSGTAIISEDAASEEFVAILGMIFA